MLTVAVTTYNRWELCLKALGSVCGQEGVDMEVILVDDCSTNPMPDQVQDSVQANGVVHIRHETNKGLAAARNSAIAAAKGKYFSFCDDDDQWPAGMAAGLVEAMEQAPEGVGMGVGIARERRETCGGLFDGQTRLSTLFHAGYTPPVAAQIYRTDLVRQVGGYTPAVRSGVDHDLWVNLLEVDPRVSVSWGEPVLVGSNPSRERMTTNESKRRQGIQDALEIWRPKLVAALGEDFYRHFCHSYEQYLDYKFFMQALRSKRHVKALALLWNFNVMPMFMKAISRKITGRRKYILFPAYKGSAGRQ